MNHDVVIVGGGLAGGTLGCYLGNAGLRVAVVEARPAPSRLGAAKDVRVSALTPASERILRRAGIWNRIPPECACAFREMVVWDAGGAGEVHFEAAEIGAPELGHIVENQAIERALEAASVLGKVRWYRPASLENLQVQADGVQLQLDVGRVQARLAVGADGSHSRVRALAGIECASGDYGQRAVVATLATELGHRDTAWQRFLPTGPLALLPLPGGRVSIVWSTTPEHAQQLLAVDAARFEREVSETAEWRLGAMRLEGERGSFPLLHLRAHSYVSDRIALIGDAAHTIHPLAGQGVNLGLLDAAALAEVAIARHEAGRDIGLRSNLRPYERSRKAHNQLMHHAMAAFHRLFGSDLEAIVTMRGLGLRLTDRVPPLKRCFMLLATGSAGDLPALARSEGVGSLSGLRGLLPPKKEHDRT